MSSFDKFRVLLAVILAAVPAGSFYSWSVFIKPREVAEPSWTGIIVHANSILLVTFGVACAISGQLEKKLGQRGMGMIGAVISGFGAVLVGIAFHFTLKPLIYIGAIFNGFGLAPSYISSLLSITSVWADKKGFASGYFMAVSSSGSYVFAMTNFAILHVFGANEEQSADDAKRTLAYSFYCFGGIIFFMQFVGSAMLIEEKKITDNSVKSTKPVALYYILRSYQFWLLLFVFMTVLTPTLGLLSIMSDMLQNVFSVTPLMGATYLALINVAGGIVRLGVGMGVDFFKARIRLVFHFFLLLQVVIFAFLPKIQESGVKYFPLFYFFVILGKSCYASGMTLINLLGGQVYGDVNGVQVYSFLIFGFVGAAILGPLLAVNLSIGNYCYANSIVAAIGAVSFCFLREYKPPHQFGSIVSDGPLLRADSASTNDKDVANYR